MADGARTHDNRNHNPVFKPSIHAGLAHISWNKCLKNGHGFMRPAGVQFQALPHYWKQLQTFQFPEKRLTVVKTQLQPLVLAIRDKRPSSHLYTSRGCINGCTFKFPTQLHQHSIRRTCEQSVAKCLLKVAPVTTAIRYSHTNCTRGTSPPHPIAVVQRLFEADNLSFFNSPP